jgi:hypothetical protein
MLTPHSEQQLVAAVLLSASIASPVLKAKIRLSKFHHGTKLWASHNSFTSQTTSGRKRQPGRQAHGPWGHSPSSSAPCAVPMTLSRIDQHIEDEPCAKQRALLGTFSSRYSSRFSRCPICWSILTFHL